MAANTEYDDEPVHTYTPPRQTKSAAVSEIERIVSNSPEVFGLTEIQGKTTKQILRIIINRKNLIDDYFNICREINMSEYGKICAINHK